MATRRATVEGNRIAAAQNRAAKGDFRSNVVVGGAQIGINAELMSLLIEAMTLSREYDAKLMTKSDYASRKESVVSRLNQWDRQVSAQFRTRTKTRRGGIAPGESVVSHRPMAYVPFWDETGRALVLPNHAKIARRHGKRATGFKLVALFGETHMRMMRFVSRPRSANGSVVFSPGNMRVRRHGGGRRSGVVNTQSFGYYMSANGKRVSVGASNSSRLAQLSFFMGGQQGIPVFARNPNFRPYTSKSGRNVSLGTFLNPHEGGRGLRAGERVGRRRGRDGRMQYSIGTPGASGSSAAGFIVKGLADSSARALRGGFRRGDNGAAFGGFGGGVAEQAAFAARLRNNRRIAAATPTPGPGFESPAGLGSVISSPLAFDEDMREADRVRMASDVEQSEGRNVRRRGNA